MRCRCTDRGSATVELVLLTPLLIVMLLFVVALGRVASARQEVDAAARDAARAAANARSSTGAQTAGEDAAHAALSQQSVTCRDLQVQIRDDFHAGGVVTARIECTVALGDLVGLGVPGSRTITASFVAPVDQYRGTS